MTRLAILDPTDRANQPMSWQGRHLVYNGEVYNFKALRSQLRCLGVPFSTTGDTEVVLKALVEWGPESCRRFAGMFAFALWDEHRQELTVGRDRYGVKPLYWRPLAGGGIAIASEATPLTSNSLAQPRLESVREFLRFGSPISSCIYQDIVEVEPGTLTTWSVDGECDTSMFAAPTASAIDGPAALRAAGSDSLVSDRPVALFLSGGFDSAAIAATTVGTGSQPVTVTLATSGNDVDVHRAAATATNYGLEHRVFHVALSDARGILDDFLNAMDQPTIDGFNTFLISRAAIEGGFPVALSGLGGDEVMGGYGYYRWRRQVDVAAALWRRVPDPARVTAARAMARSLHRRPSEVVAILDAESLGDRHRAWRTLFTADEVARLTGADSIPSVQWHSNPAESPDAQLCRLDFRTYLRPTLLRDTDVFSMANSVEVRVPLLDERFVAAMRSGPALRKEDLAKNWGDEYLLALARKPKLTFGLPWRDWIAPVLIEKGSILESDDPWRGLVDPTVAKEMLAELTADGSGALRSWALVVLAVWLTRTAASRHLGGHRA